MKIELRTYLSHFGSGLLACAAFSMALLPSTMSSSAFGQEAKEQTAEESEDSEANQEEVEEEEFSPITRTEFNNLLRKRKYEEMAERLDASLEQAPEDAGLISMNATLGMLLTRSDAEAAKKRLGEQFQKLMKMEQLNSSLASSLTTTTNYLVSSDSEMTTDAKIKVFDSAIEKVSDVSVADAVSYLNTAKCRLLIADDRAAEAKQIMDELIEQKRSAIEEGNPRTITAFTSAARSYQALSDDYPEEATKVFGEACEIFVSKLQKEDAGPNDFIRYYGFVSPEISRLTYSDPEGAAEMLDGLTSELDSLKEKLEEEDLGRLKNYVRNLSSLRSRLQSSLERARLIGMEAPEIDAEHFVATDPVTMEDLKGKVVLVDFWAVWCGPCIATFPHLIEWHEEFADKGLVILGATKFYNYAWDEEAGRANRSSDDVAPEDELAMLEKFRESHGLHHGFFVSGKDSDYSKQFKVSGIPQAVLIDQEGKIAMVKVGSGEANAKALHAKIEELLAE